MTPGAPQGILVVDKPSGPTSHDVVARLRRIFGTRQVGHCGTLDPLATGVLVTCLGRYTRLSPWLTGQDKEYHADLQLGSVSTTGDAQGELTPVAGAKPCAAEDVSRVLATFLGHIEQVPPAHSAVRIDGERAYRRARRHEEVVLPARRVCIRELQLECFAYPRLVLRVVCSKGTYVRSLATDIGARLGCGAYVAQLRRLRAGALDLQDAHTLEALQVDCAPGAAAPFVPVLRALSGLAHVALPAEQAERFTHGGPVAVASTAPADGPVDCAVFRGDGAFCGIGRWDVERGQLSPVRVVCAVGAEA